MTVAHRVIIWMFTVLYNSTKTISNNGEQRTDPTRYLRRSENGPLETGDALTIWVCLLYDLSEAGNPYSEGIETIHFFTNINAYLGRCNSSDKTKPKAS